MSTLSELSKGRRIWKKKMWRFLGLCPKCGRDPESYYTCKKCRNERSIRQFKKRRLQKRECKLVGCNNIIGLHKQYCDICIWKREAAKHSCIVNFNICIDCGALFTARRMNKKRCDICGDRTTIGRKLAGLKKLKRKCLNPVCNKEFITYKKKQFACSKECSNIVVGIRRTYEKKMSRFLGLCVYCGAEAHGNPLCERCRKRLSINQKERRSKWKSNRHCIECGSSDIIKGKNTCEYCSNNRARRSYKSSYKRKKAEMGLFVEYVDRLILFDRDNGRCQICMRKVNIKLKWPHPRCATRDHIIPLSKGGETSYKNMQLAHWECNRLKNNRPVPGGEQLRLFG